MIKPEVLDAMVAAGCTAEQIAAAVKADQASSSGAARQARYRARKASPVTSRDVTAVTVTPQVSPKKETSPTPPKEKTTPSQSETNVSSKTPRQALETVLDQQRAGDVIDHRQRIRKPLTVKAAQLLAKEFAKCADPNAGADAMVLNGWQGFDPAWLDRHQARGSPTFVKPERYDPFKAYAQELTDEQSRSSRSDRGDWDDAQSLPIRTIEHHG